jgi:hypothetical protein
MEQDREGKKCGGRNRGGIRPGSEAKHRAAGVLDSWVAVQCSAVQCSAVQWIAGWLGSVVHCTALLGGWGENRVHCDVGSCRTGGRGRRERRRKRRKIKMGKGRNQYPDPIVASCI